MAYEWALNIYKLARAKQDTKSTDEFVVYKRYVALAGLVKDGAEPEEPVIVPEQPKAPVAPIVEENPPQTIVEGSSTVSGTATIKKAPKKA